MRVSIAIVCCPACNLELILSATGQQEEESDSLSL